MNRESEAINQFLAWLLQDRDLTDSAPSGDGSISGTDATDSGAATLQFNELDPLDSEEGMASPSTSTESNQFSFQETPLFQPGDRSAVQDRFHSLLKRRLRTEIERKPPLFPWETEISEYEAVTPDWAASELVPTSLWLAQLQHLNLPVPMPEVLLSQLLNQCQAVVQSTLREGTKLVQAVESLFPGHASTLNQLAGMVLTAPARSERSSQATVGFPSSYDVATQPQQMVLSLLAAREILDSLTLTVSSDEPRTERQWVTGSGLITLTAEYPTTGSLRIESQLPCSGSLRLQGHDAQANAHRSSPGALSVELFDLSPNQIYPLEIRLMGTEQPPLVFAVHPKTLIDG